MYNLITMWDKPSADYYLNCVMDDFDLVTESILLEMEVTLQDVTRELLSCEL